MLNPRRASQARATPALSAGAASRLLPRTAEDLFYFLSKFSPATGLDEERQALQLRLGDVSGCQQRDFDAWAEVPCLFHAADTIYPLRHNDISEEEVNVHRLPEQAQSFRSGAATRPL